MTKVPVFVYGTLRPGDYNHSRYGLEGEENVVRGVTAPGALYHVDSRGRLYPCAKFDEKGIIVGDVLFFDADDQNYRRICGMEVGAGYEMREVIVTLEDGSQMKCQAFHYHRNTEGPRIESGDWYNDTTVFPTQDHWWDQEREVDEEDEGKFV